VEHISLEHEVKSVYMYGTEWLLPYLDGTEAINSGYHGDVKS
jgi:hypothetical protein